MERMGAAPIGNRQGGRSQGLGGHLPPVEVGSGFAPKRLRPVKVAVEPLEIEQLDDPVVHGARTLVVRFSTPGLTGR